MKNTISISEASRITGISQKRLRSFENRGYIIPPARITSGSIQYRRYSPENIRNIKAFKRYLDEGFTLPVASQKALDEMKKEDN